MHQNERHVSMRLHHPGDLRRMAERRVPLVKHYPDAQLRDFPKDRLDAITDAERDVPVDRRMELDHSKPGLRHQLAEARDRQIGVQEGIGDEAAADSG
jgi:hypothetical protein